MNKLQKQKKIAMFNDLSGYGRCSLTVALPVISAMKVQCCPVPTSILSNHTAFPTCYRDDYTEHIGEYVGQWKQLGLEFDGIASGYLGSVEQVEQVIDFIHQFRKEHTKIIIDPIMGDHGKVYSSFTEEMCREISRLTAHGNVVTPNLTEACILTGTPYKENGWKKEELQILAEKLLAMGPSAVVITGIKQGSFITNLIAEAGKGCCFQKSKKVGHERPGTGDIFSAIVAAGVVRGIELTECTRMAAGFVKACIAKSEEMQIPEREGVCFEEMLSLLCGR